MTQHETLWRGFLGSASALTRALTIRSGSTDEAIAHHGMLDPATPFIQEPFTLEPVAERNPPGVKQGIAAPRIPPPFELQRGRKVRRSDPLQAFSPSRCA